MTLRPARAAYDRLRRARSLAAALMLSAFYGTGESAAQTASNVEIVVEGVVVMSVTTPYAQLARSSFRNILRVSPRGEISIQSYSDGWADAPSSGRFGDQGETRNQAGRSQGTLRIGRGNRIDNRFRVTTNAGSVVEAHRVIRIEGDLCFASVNYQIRTRDGLARAHDDRGNSVTLNRVWAENVACAIRRL